MIAVETMLNMPFFIDFIDDFISVLFGSCCEDSQLIKLMHIFNEFLGMGTNMVLLAIDVEMDESLIEIKDKVSIVMRKRRWKERIRWHFKDLPFEGFIQKCNKFKRIQVV